MVKEEKKNYIFAKELSDILDKELKATIKSLNIYFSMKDEDACKKYLDKAMDIVKVQGALDNGKVFKVGVELKPDAKDIMCYFVEFAIIETGDYWYTKKIKCVMLNKFEHTLDEPFTVIYY